MTDQEALWQFLSKEYDTASQAFHEYRQTRVRLVISCFAAAGAAAGVLVGVHELHSPIEHFEDWVLLMLPATFAALAFVTYHMETRINACLSGLAAIEASINASLNGPPAMEFYTNYILGAGTWKRHEGLVILLLGAIGIIADLWLLLYIVLLSPIAGWMTWSASIVLLAIPLLMMAGAFLNGRVLDRRLAARRLERPRAVQEWIRGRESPAG